MSRALSVISGLKPEVKLGVALSEFAQALDADSRARFSGLRNGVTASPTTGDVIKITEELNREGAKLHRAWRPSSTRLATFLSRIQSLASIGDVILGGSQNLIASGVWCAIRMCLDSAIGFLTYFDKISTVFMKLGTAWSLHSNFGGLFPQSSELQTFLSEYLTTVVHLCKKIVVFTKKSTFKQFTTSLLHTFDGEFGPLLSELDQWGRLIEQKSNILATESLLQSEDNAVQRNVSLVRRLSTSAKRERNFDRKQRLLLSLSPDQSIYETQWRRQRRKGTCYWVFETPEYRLWRQRTSSCTLWLNGSIGSGKTVALANIIADIHLRQQCTFFFCQAKEPKSLLARNVIGSIAYQILRNIPTDAPFWGSFDVENIPISSGPEALLDLVLKGLDQDVAHFIAVDGLEECPRDEILEVLEFLHKLMQKRTILLCCSGKPESWVQRELFSTINIEDGMSVTLNNQARYREIEEYIDREIERRLEGKTFDKNLEALMKSQLKAGAQGMYLWVTLQLEVLLPTYSGSLVSAADICQMLSNLPKDLPEAFDHALSRIEDKRYRNRLFKIIAAAERPLKLDEFQVALTVLPGETTWDPAKLPSDPTAVVYLSGGNLIEIDEEDQGVHFIHHSALLHLLSEPQVPSTALFHFALEDAVLDLGSICVAYLNYGIFDSRMISKHVLPATKITGQVVKAATRESPVLSFITRHIVNHRRSSSFNDIDMLRISQEILSASAPKIDIPRSFLPYAKAHWLDHTRHFDIGMDAPTWNCWTTLAAGELAHVSVPWQRNRTSMFRWAVVNAHGALFQYTIHIQPVDEGDEPTFLEMTRGDPRNLGIGTTWLDDILAQCIAARIWDWEVLDYLLEAGASPIRAHHQNGQIPLQLLISTKWIPEEKRSRVITQFVQHPRAAEPLKDACHPSWLVSPILDGWDSIVLTLIDLATTVQVFPPMDSPLAAAVQIGSTKLVSKLMDAGALPSNSYISNKPAVQVAFEKKRCDLLEVLARETGVMDNIRIEHMSLLQIAIRQADVDMVSCLLKIGVDANLISLGRSPLQAAVETSKTSIVRLLLNFGADVNYSFPTPPLVLAIQRRSLSMVKVLLETEASRIVKEDRFEMSVLLVACRIFAGRETSGDSTKREVEIFNSLLDDRKESAADDINLVDQHGYTLLHYAARWGQIDLARLVELGADVNFESSGGETPLYLTVAKFQRSREWALVRQQLQALLKAGADPNRCCHDVSIMQVATSCDKSDALEVLLSHGGNANTENLAGSRLLHIAAACSNANATRLLLSHGAEINARDADDRTAVDLAFTRWRLSTIGCLLEARPILPVGCLQRALSFIMQGHAASCLVSMLLGAGADPNETTDEPILGLIFRSALSIANYEYHLSGTKSEVLKAASILLDHGPDPNLKINGEPILDHALMNCWPELVLKLLKRGADSSHITVIGTGWRAKLVGVRLRGLSESLLDYARSRSLLSRAEEETWMNVIFVLTLSEDERKTKKEISAGIEL